MADVKSIRSYSYHLLEIQPKMVAILCLWCLLPILHSCIREELNGNPGKTEGTHVTLTLNLPKSNNTTRALNEDEHENSITHIYVLLFDQDSGKYIEKAEALEADIITDSNDSHIKRFEVTLPYGAYDLMLLANVKDIVDVASLHNNMDKDEVTKALKFTETDTRKWGDPATFTPFPMWGEVKGVEIKKGITSPSEHPIYMIRSVVRIDVILPYLVTNNGGLGTLQSVYLYNYYTEGQIIPDDGTCIITNPASTDPELSVSGPSIPSGAGKTVGPLFYEYDKVRSDHTNGNPNAGDTLVATIYTFEALAGSKNYLENTCLVLGIGGKVDKGGATAPPRTRAIADSTYYYRVDFVTGAQDDPDPGFIPLLRNHNYCVEVQQIVNRGFPEPGQAYRSEPYDLTYTVAEWESDYKAEINYENYRLDLSETSLEMDNINNYEIIEVVTTHPEGWSAYISKYPDRIEAGENLSIPYVFSLDGEFYFPEASKTEILNLPAGDILYLFLEAGNPGKDNSVEVYVHIVAGNLTNVITVKIHGYELV